LGNKKNETELNAAIGVCQGYDILKGLDKLNEVLQAAFTKYYTDMIRK
jgi:hypothetical protein